MALINWKSKKDEREVNEEIAAEEERRRKRFRILVCLNGTDAAYRGVRLAAEIGGSEECDIILLYVRRIDQGLNTGGLQVRVARQNMLDWGLDLPGIEYLKTGLQILDDEAHITEEWKTVSAHTDVFGDPLGDNKVEYRSPTGKSVVLKLKTAVDVASGILDQYELGPYNLIITGSPKRWRGEYSGLRDPSTVQKVAVLAPCSVLATRDAGDRKGYLIHLSRSINAFKLVQRASVLAHHCGEQVTLISVAENKEEVAAVESRLNSFRERLEKFGVPIAGILAPIGDPALEIIKAGKNYKLITVADSGKTRLKRFITGSIAFDVMGKADASVLNVR